MPNDRGRAWCFTLNNPTETEIERLSRVVGDDISYICWGREVGDAGTPHLQGYLELGRKHRLNGVKQLVGERLHLELRRGTQEQAILYCQKDGAFTEYGEKIVSAQGQRTDLERVVEGLRGGKRLAEVALEEPMLYCKYRNGIRDIAGFLQKRRAEPPKVFYVFGLPGTGKSRWAYEYDPESTWSYGGDGWFDGYQGQRVAIFDDFCDDLSRDRCIGYSLFLKLLDRYPLSVPVKGGFVSWLPETIIITSNRSLQCLYRGNEAYVWEAIERRVTEVKEMS